MIGPEGYDRCHLHVRRRIEDHHLNGASNRSAPRGIEHTQVKHSDRGVHGKVQSEVARKALIIEATNGLDAIAKTEAARPDLIILDMSMPEMNGFEAATVLRKTLPQVPIFMFTAHDSPTVESKAASVGIRAVFSKYTGINALAAQASVLLSPSR